MKFSYNWLQSLVSGKLPRPEKLTGLLTMHSFEISELKKMGSDWLIDIDVLPNRAGDCFSHLGIARECAVLTGTQLKVKSEKLKEERSLKAKDFVSVTVQNKKACPRYTARVVIDVKVGESPKFIQERLKVCGLRPINNIVDIANYVMLETGQPLHAFDLEKLGSVNLKSQIPNPQQIPNPKFQNKKLIVRFAKNKERIVTLDEERYDLNDNVLVIADRKKPVAIAGIKGGKEPEIDRKTKIVVIESANFNSRVIRKGSQKLNLKTDASLRFEHGIDPNLTEPAVNQAALMIQKIAGGKIAQGLIDYYPLKLLPKKVNLDLNYVEKLLGIKIPTKEIQNILKKLNFRINKSGSCSILVTVPTFRLDINIPEDLIEEIGRIAGYEKIPATSPLIPLSPAKRNDLIFWEDFSKRILKELGFSEVYNYSFISEKLREILGYKPGELIGIENPISVEQKYLRPSLIPNLLINLQKNISYFNDIKLFELAKIYRQKRSPEKKMLAGLILKKENKSTAELFSELKGSIDSLLNQLGISNIWYDFYQPSPEEGKSSFWQLKKSAEIKVDQTEIGFLGEISPKILEQLKINHNLVFFEIDFEKLAQFSSEEQEFRPLSRYPSAVRDLALLVPRRVLVEEVLNEINIAGGKVVRDVDLFDIYEGRELPGGKKNLAFHIIYQAEDRTLKSAEIDEIHQRIIKALEKNLDWQVRR
jgi:phenylalanyl-tRNA synthetase beta chain